LWGLSPVCISMCVLRWPSAVYPLWHTSQLYGLSSVCVSRCFFRLLARVNCFWHTKHLCGIPPACINLCVWRLLARVNVLWQMSHSCSLSPVCTSLINMLDKTVLSSCHCPHPWLTEVTSSVGVMYQLKEAAEFCSSQLDPCVCSSAGSCNPNRANKNNHHITNQLLEQ